MLYSLIKMKLLKNTVLKFLWCPLKVLNLKDLKKLINLLSMLILLPIRLFVLYTFEHNNLSYIPSTSASFILFVLHTFDFNVL